MQTVRLAFAVLAALLVMTFADEAVVGRFSTEDKTAIAQDVKAVVAAPVKVQQTTTPANCSTYTCPAGQGVVDRTKVCTDACTDAQCCATACSTYDEALCTNGRIANAAVVGCPNGGLCDDATCCRHKCPADYVCPKLPSIMVPRINATLITCNGSKCVDIECCQVVSCMIANGINYTSGAKTPWKCSAALPIATSQQLKSVYRGATWDFTCKGGVCTDGQCCEFYCSSYSCGAQKKKEGDMGDDKVPCVGSCDWEQCCEEDLGQAIGMNVGVSCGLFFLLGLFCLCDRMEYAKRKSAGAGTA